MLKEIKGTQCYSVQGASFDIIQFTDGTSIQFQHIQYQKFLVPGMKLTADLYERLREVSEAQALINEGFRDFAKGYNKEVNENG